MYIYILLVKGKFNHGETETQLKWIWNVLFSGILQRRKEERDGGIKPTSFTEMQLNQQFVLLFKLILDEEKHKKLSPYLKQNNWKLLELFDWGFLSILWGRDSSKPLPLSKGHAWPIPLAHREAISLRPESQSFPRSVPLCKSYIRGCPEMAEMGVPLWSISRWDFPNKPSSDKGLPPWRWKPTGIHLEGYWWTNW